MKKNHLDYFIRNLARGGQKYYKHRSSVTRQLIEYTNESVSELPSFLASSFFSIKDNTDFLAARFREEDWNNLRKLSAITSNQLDENYLRLTIQFIKNNISRVSKLFIADHEVLQKLFMGNYNGALETFHALGPDEKQSIYAFHLFSAVSSTTERSVAEYFGNNRHSSWVKKRLLYPLIYLYLHQASELYADQILSQLFPEYSRNKHERSAVFFLLQSFSGENLSLARKCYIALLCHPFDAVEIIIKHFESVTAQGKAVAHSTMALLDELSNIVPASRLKTVVSLLKKESLNYQDTFPDPTTESGLSENTLNLIRNFVEPKDKNTTHPFSSSENVLSALHRLRWMRYPTRDDFLLVTHVAYRYSFTSFGRILRVLLTSIYMWERTDHVQEICDLIRQYDLYGTITPFLLTSPRAADTRAKSLFFKIQGMDTEKIENAVDLFKSQVDFNSRWWIKYFHWDLRKSEEDLRVSQWLDEVRRNIPISGNKRFLSGINWDWIDEVLALERLRPFSGNPSGAFVLLLRLVETRQRESNVLRFALIPIVNKHPQLESFVEWLIQEFQENSIAFVRFFLSPDVILKMKLELQYTAALTERLIVLESLTELFGFPEDLITEEELAQEQKVVATALTLMRLGAHQFEIPWASLREDAKKNTIDDFNAYFALIQTYRSLPLLSDAKSKGHYFFSNKQTHEYELPNSQWPLTQLICAIIDTFLAHPSFGIESILAIRIRHDNFRREFAGALDHLKRATVLGVPAVTRFHLIRLFEDPIYEKIQEWIDRYMHTGGNDKSHALFSFIPHQKDMEELLRQTSGSETFDQILDVVFLWLREKLKGNLTEAKLKLSHELKPALEATVDSVGAISKNTDDVEVDTIDRITSAIRTAILTRADLLLDWFNVPERTDSSSIDYACIRLVIEDRFRTQVQSKELKISMNYDRFLDKLIPEEHVRQVFHLWSELTLNALKYSNRKTAYCRVKSFQAGNISGLIFSSLRISEDVGEEFIEGDPWTTKSETQFKDRKSGQQKVASLAASIVRAPIKVRICRRKRGYHVFVPLILNQNEIPNAAA